MSPPKTLCALGLLACRPPEPGPALPPAPEPASPAPRPVLASPAEATDTDPDPSALRVALQAAPLTFQVGEGAIEGWAYNGQVPGPTLRARVGDRVVVDFTNALPEPTTVHWHGLGVPAEMDGAGWPMPEIAPGERFTFDFLVEQPGTFWYHPHLDTDHQLDRGLYGVVVVEDPAEPVADAELVLVLDAFGEPHAAESDPHLVDATLQTWAVNGLVDPALEVPAGSVLRVRALNASNAGYVALSALPGQAVIAHDQGLLASPEQQLLLAPGDRAELEWRIGEGLALERLPFTVAGGPAWGEPARLLQVVGEPGAALPEGLPWPHGGERPSADPGTTDVRLLLTGSPELGWEINGETFPDVTVPALALGAEAVIEVRNVSPSHHPFHVHGHRFEVLSVDGVPPEHKTVEDTIDVPLYGVVRLLLVADNPGLWMMHCHVLPHAEGGMMTLLRVQ